MDVAISTLRAELSTWIERARSGEEVVVTDRGTPVARLLASGCRSGRTSAMASSPSSATVEIVTVFDSVCAGVPISVNHDDAALFCQHRVAAHLRHHSLDLALDLRLYRNHHIGR